MNRNTIRKVWEEGTDMKYLKQEEDLDVFIGRKVKNRRSALRISQGKLGEQLGVSFQQVQKYENGKNRISASTLYNISRVLGVKFSYFVEGYEQINSLKEGNETSYSPGMVESDLLLGCFSRIKNQSLRSLIVDLVKNMANLSSK